MQPSYLAPRVRCSAETTHPFRLVGSHCHDADYSILFWSCASLPLRYDNWKTQNQTKQKHRHRHKRLGQTSVYPILDVFVLCPVISKKPKKQGIYKATFCLQHPFRFQPPATSDISVPVSESLWSIEPDCQPFLFLLIFCPLWNSFSEKRNRN